jgi:hypothetical protein
MRPAYVYRMYSADDVLLYVGMAYEVSVRENVHRYTTPWGDQIDRVEVTEYPTRSEAAAAESEAIRTERPRWNSKGRPGRKDWTACDYFEELERISLIDMEWYEPWQRRVRVLAREFYNRYPNVAEQTLPSLGITTLRVAS